MLCNIVGHRKGWEPQGTTLISNRFDWRGFSSTSNVFRNLHGHPIDPEAADFLANRNDGRHSFIDGTNAKWDFNQIADWVEEYL